MDNLVKESLNNSKISLNHEITEINIDLMMPRIIIIKGTDKKGREITWHLKITEKGRLVLV